MKFNDRLYEDLGHVAHGAASVFNGFRDQFGPRGLANTPDLVSREEFESVRDMAAKARELQEILLRRIEALETKLANRDQAKP
jgi:BMFP domain-containing protein YqiC